MIKLKKLILPLVLFLTIGMNAQVPQRPAPARLVNDFAGILTNQQAYSLEYNLEDFARTTSNQIVVVLVNDLNGLPASDYAIQIGEKWGVGQRKFDNGVVILIKVKNQTSGEAFIATGYGLEAVLPDAICKRIVENEMIPAFRENDYYAGIVNALNVIIPIAKGEFSSDEYAAQDDSLVGFAVIMMLLVIVFIVAGIISRKNKGDDFNSGDKGKKGMDPMTAFLLGSMLGGGRRHGGSYGGFSGGGGGFGGFGGGSFGGGGAGGKW